LNFCGFDGILNAVEDNLSQFLALPSKFLTASMNKRTPRNDASDSDTDFQPAFLMRAPRGGAGAAAPKSRGPAAPASAAEAPQPGYSQPDNSQPTYSPSVPLYDSPRAAAPAPVPAAPPRPSAEGPVHGIVKWFNHAKGFGFILLDDGREVFVHSNRLDPSLSRTLKPGLDADLMIVPVAKGFACQELQRLGSEATPANLDRVGWKPQTDLKQPAPNAGHETVGAIVKFFNAQKGFGFATPDIDLGRDIYLPARVLESVGLAGPQSAGASVEVDYVKTERGFEAVALRMMAQQQSPQNYQPSDYQQPSDEFSPYRQMPDEPPHRVLGPGDFVEPWRPA
jgi:CspA family cold shock protein